MERILILMQAANWAEATEALTSARENALHRNALSYALVLPEAPTSPKNAIWRRSGRCDTLSARK